ncbi:MAG: gliding motility-associated C-terminal domain-containing protein [Paludibacter sp.]|nr:gliding motility-associated C-terminal domain-containing protein [Paludibacter sp.]
MKRRASYLIILFIALMSVVQSLAQSDQPDVVCMGTSKNYYVAVTFGSRYIWKIDDGNPESSTSNSVDINWTTSGIYILTVQEITKDNCIGTVQSLQVTVLALPTATISGTNIICQNAVSPDIIFTGAGGTAPYTFTYNINNGTNKTVTTTTGEDEVTVSVPTTVSGIFAYNLVDVTDSKSCTHVQTGTATITLNVPTYSTTKRIICPLQLPFSWNGVICPNAGTYPSVGLTNSAGCDSIATLELRVESPLISRDTVSVCASELPYPWNGYQCMLSDTYVANKLRTPAGCDSVAILVLTVHSPKTIQKTATVCEGESYSFNGQSYAAPKTYDIPIYDINGCDSIIVKLEVNQTKSKFTSQSISLFDGETYNINGNKYSTASIYTDILKTTLGCDSTVVTELSYINIPNTLTPNGDGENDVFMRDNHVQIYNRNGILLYDGSDGWDGKYKNRTVSKDTYFYVLYYPSESKIKTKEGYIMVLR